MAAEKTVCTPEARAVLEVELAGIYKRLFVLMEMEEPKGIDYKVWATESIPAIVGILTTNRYLRELRALAEEKMMTMVAYLKAHRPIDDDDVEVPTFNVINALYFMKKLVSLFFQHYQPKGEAFSFFENDICDHVLTMADALL